MVRQIHPVLRKSLPNSAAEVGIRYRNYGNYGDCPDALALMHWAWRIGPDALGQLRAQRLRCVKALRQ